jgi:ABC-2 type transport system permease protein
VKKYLHVANVGLQNTLVYRVNFFFRAAFGLVPLMATIFIWQAVYAGKTSGDEVAGYTLAQMISYYLIVTVVNTFTAVTEDDWQIAADIKDGNISQFLLKPIDYLSYRLVLFASGRLIYTLVAIIPVSIFIFFQRDFFVGPASGTHLGVFMISLVLTALLQFLISYTLALLAFWVLEVSTFIFIAFAVEYAASGQLYPLDILPPLVTKIMFFTPFPYLMFFPVNVYLGKMNGPELWAGLAMQAFWVAMAYMLARFVWSRGIKHYSAVGG